jgi:hypothetical protein
MRVFRVLIVAIPLAAAGSAIQAQQVPPTPNQATQAAPPAPSALPSGQPIIINVAPQTPATRPAGDEGMDPATFIVELVKAIAWPAVVVGLAVLFRKPVLSAARYIRRIKYGDTVVDFEVQVAKVQHKASLVFPEPAVPSERSVKYLSDLADLSPRAAIMEAWLEIEAAVGAAIKRRGLNVPAEDNFAWRLPALLQGHQLVTKSEADLIDQLRRLRNDAAHRPEFSLTPHVAKQFASAALLVAGKLRAT